jgi:hypothetical protein
MKFGKSILAVAVLSSSILLVAPVATNHFTVRAADKSEKNKDTELSKHMEEIDANYKKLRKSVKSPAENAASLDLLTKMQHDTVASKALVPAKLSTVKEADRPKFIAGYRKEMAALLEHLCKIEVALVDNDNAKAEDLVKQIKKIEDDGHEKFSDE